MRLQLTAKTARVPFDPLVRGVVVRHATLTVAALFASGVHFKNLLPSPATLTTRDLAYACAPTHLNACILFHAKTDSTVATLLVRRANIRVRM